MAALREWLTSVVVVSMLLSVAQLLVPEGTLRKIASFTGGLVLLAALLRPVLGADLGRLRLDLSDYREAVEQRQAELSEESGAEIAELIAARTEAYISEEAVRLGAAVTVRVETEAGADGVPVPVGAVLTGPRSQALSDYMANQLGIPVERQVWQDGNDEN